MRFSDPAINISDCQSGLFLQPRKMHWELLLLVVLVWWFTSCCPDSLRTEMENEWNPTDHQNDLMVINRIQDQLDRLLQLAQRDARIYGLTGAAQHCKYRLWSHPERTFVVNKSRIYLLIYDREKGRYFDENTLLQAAIHELAHVLCPEVDQHGHHGSKFDAIEDRLLWLAHHHQLIDRNISPDPRYHRCHC